MSYSKISTLLGQSMDSLTDSDLRSLNSAIVKEINHRIAVNRLNIKRTLGIGATVVIDDPRCIGKTYTIEKISSKTAVLVENGSTHTHPLYGNPISKKIRASITMLKSA